MKKTLLMLFVAALTWGVAEAQVRLASKYSFPLLPSVRTARDSMLNELKSIRGCAFATDVDGDNLSEIAATTYGGAGGVSVFEAVGNDSLRLVWTSPRVASGGGSSTPRYVLFGDMDDDGRKEVIFQSANNGIFIFEWDGVVGSDNYGTQPSQVINTAFLSGVAGNCEYMEVGDVDGDAQQELLAAYNSTPDANDKYYIIHADGGWSTNDPEFSSFVVEYAGIRTNLATWGISGGTPYAMIAAQFDGTGNKEILIHNWNLKNVVPMRVPAANTYLLSDTTTNKQNRFLSRPDDDVALFGGMACDIDNDGREEVYLPTYPASGSANNGFVHMISYSIGESTAIIDSVNVTKLSAGYIGTTFGYGYGDINGNGKKEFYTSGSYPHNVTAIEFQGGDKRDPANWVARLVYKGDSTLYADQVPPDPFLPAFVITDSLGVRDTTRRIDPSFPSKIYGRNTDFDRDGREDIILPYQALVDTLTTYTRTWNTGTSKYDTVITKEVNPKRWSLRVIERDLAGAVDGKDVTIIMPDDYRLEQNYPNPFNPSTTIAFYLPIKDRISLKVYDVLGREVRTLINNENYDRGTSKIVWDGKDNVGRLAATGTYFYTLKFGNFEKTNKAMLVK